MRPCRRCGHHLTLQEAAPLLEHSSRDAAFVLERLEARGRPEAAAVWELWTCPNPACDCDCSAWQPVREAPRGGATPCVPR